MDKALLIEQDILVASVTDLQIRKAIQLGVDLKFERLSLSSKSK